MDKIMDEGKQIEKAKDRRIWLISTGEGGERWQDCIDKGIICGGWKEFVVIAEISRNLSDNV